MSLCSEIFKGEIGHWLHSKSQNYNKSNRNVQTSKDNYYLETLQNNYKSQEEEDEARFKFEEEKRRQISR